MQRPQVCGASKLGQKKTNGPTISFTTGKQTPRETPPQTPPRSLGSQDQGWRLSHRLPRSIHHGTSGTRGTRSFHPRLGWLGGGPQLVRLYRMPRTNWENFRGISPWMWKNKNDDSWTQGHFFGGGVEVGTKDLKVCLYFRVNSWTSWHKDSSDPENSQWRKVGQKLDFRNSGSSKIGKIQLRFR